MGSRGAGLLAGGIWLCTVVYAFAQTAEGALRAGSAKVDISPSAAELRPGDILRDPLFARAIVIDNGQTCAALVGLDQGGASTELINDVIARASASTRCPPQNFIISATHTHSGNSGQGDGLRPTTRQIADAIVSAIETAKRRLEPVRVGYGTTVVDLNTNRDLFDDKGNWVQQPNPLGHSDKTLAVVEFIGRDYVPVGVYLNYAMHPINFYLTGVVSADFAGEASRYVERTFGEKTVAVFSQGASGNQNPRLLDLRLTNIRTGQGETTQTIGAPPPPSTSNNAVRDMQQAFQRPLPQQSAPAYQRQMAHTSDLVAAMGAILGQSAIEVMRNDIRRTTDTGTIRAAVETVTCPGRDRTDGANPVRENALPPYRDGADVNIRVSALRIADINFAGVNGEVYSEIAHRLKRESPEAKTMMVSLANGRANSGYIYSDTAAANLTFQVIGSRLKPRCAETKIVDAGVRLIQSLNR